MRPILPDFLPLAYVVFIYKISFDNKDLWMTMLSRLDLELGLPSFCSLYSNMTSAIVV